MSVELIDEFYYVSIEDHFLCVSRQVGLDILSQLRAGAEILAFADLYGREIYVPAKNFLSMWWSTPETRKTIREHNELMTEEQPPDWKS